MLAQEIILNPNIKLLLVASIITILFFYTRKNKKHKYIDPSITPPFKLNIPLTGSLQHLGGMLLDDKHVLHVSRWPHDLGEEVRLTGVDKVNISRKIVSKETLEYYDQGDISILSLDKPIDILNHRRLDIVEPKVGEQVTVIRQGRPPFGTYIESIDNKKNIIYLSSESDLDSIFLAGDSGKPWLVKRDGKLCMISFTSYGKKGTGALLYNYNDKIKNTLAVLNSKED